MGPWIRTMRNHAPLKTTLMKELSDTASLLPEGFTGDHPLVQSLATVSWNSWAGRGSTKVLEHGT